MFLALLESHIALWARSRDEKRKKRKTLTMKRWTVSWGVCLFERWRMQEIHLKRLMRNLSWSRAHFIKKLYLQLWIIWCALFIQTDKWQSGAQSECGLWCNRTFLVFIVSCYYCFWICCTPRGELELVTKTIGCISNKVKWALTMAGHVGKK